MSNGYSFNNLSAFLMIPLILHIKNFLSYGSPAQTIDFTNHALICLAGKNGHGKSALLDALTWALWGQARKVGGTAKADEGLVRLGQTSMMVSLDFICNGTQYRVRREYAYSASKPYALLDFGMLDPESGFLRPLTDKTIRATQEKIDAVLGLTFETFVNSAFLRQGQSNEFSKKTAKERKEILATLLGLDTFDKLRKKSVEKGAELKSSKDQYQKLSERLQIVLLGKDLFLETKKSFLETVQANKVLIENNIKEQELLQIAQKKDDLAYQKIAVKLLYQEDISKKREEAEVVLREKFSVWRSVFKKQKQIQNPEVIQKALFEKEAKKEEMQLVYKKKMELKQELLQDQVAYQDAYQKIQSVYTAEILDVQALLHAKELNIHEIQTQKKIAESSYNNSEQEILTAQKAMHIVQEIIDKKSLLAHSLREQEKQFEKRKIYYHAWIARGKQLEAALLESNQKSVLVKKDTDSECPLCEQKIFSEHKETLAQKFVLQKNCLLATRKKLLVVTKRLKELLVQQHAVLEDLKKQYAHIGICEEQHKEYIKKEKTAQLLFIELSTQKIVLTRMLEEEEQIKKELLIKKDLLNTTSISIEEHDDFLKNHKKNMQQKEHEFELFIYNEEELIVLQAELLQLKQQQERYNQLLIQVQLQGQRKTEIYSLCTLLRTIKHEQKEKELLFIAQKEYQAIQENYAIQERIRAQQKAVLVEEQSLLLQKRGSLDEQERIFDASEKEYLVLQESLKKYDHEIQQYQLISTALGKDGIQALLIEDALPEIEYEANLILGKLTDNQAQVSIESLRDLKSGGTKETLEIKISDGIGIRPYEMFSGGEAFRIDFALRIALSKILARKAGTPLQTLIIDEGFGSQDEEGLHAIIDALYAIQADFEKIIIVSHIAHMREQLPVQFLIQKGPNGSLVNILEQG